MRLASGRASPGAAAATAGRGRLPLGITTIIGFAFLAAIRLSRMNPARPIVLQPESSSPPPCSR